jgi:lysophospholipase L1-like esterase
MDPAATGSRKRKRLLALGLALVLGFAAGELGARLVFGAPMAERLPLMFMRAHPTRGWAMVPGQTHYTYTHEVRLNALGLRGPELGPKEPGERRVLFLGDSLTYGQGVAEEDTVPSALERELAARTGTKWTVVNAGHRAYDTVQELALLEELGEAIQPDVVLLGWYWNDVNERPIQTTFENLGPRGEIAFDTGNTVEGFDRVAWRLKQLVRSSALVMVVHDAFSSKGKPYEPDYFDKGLQRLGRYLERFRARCATLGAVPVFVQYPDPALLAGAGATRPYDERALALAHERSLATVELLPALEPLFEARGRAPTLPFDGHYDGAANRAMGTHLAAVLLELEVVRGP